MNFDADESFIDSELPASPRRTSILPQMPPPHHNILVFSKYNEPVCESQDGNHESLTLDPSADGNERDQQDKKGAEMADEEVGSGIDSEWNTPPHLHPPKKQSLCRAAKKPCIKRRRFSSQPSSDEESETGDESDYSSYIPSQTHHISKPQLPSHLTSLRSDTRDHAMDLAGGRSRTAVI